MLFRLKEYKVKGDRVYDQCKYLVVEQLVEEVYKLYVCQGVCFFGLGLMILVDIVIFFYYCYDLLSNEFSWI